VLTRAGNAAAACYAGSDPTLRGGVEREEEGRGSHQCGVVGVADGAHKEDESCCSWTLGCLAPALAMVARKLKMTWCSAA
jgi:hypothetical protein